MIGAASGIDMPRCPRCEFLYNVPRGTYVQCGRDLALPPTEAEQHHAEEACRREEATRQKRKRDHLRASREERSCYGCGATRGLWSWLESWENCGMCGASHCPACWQSARKTGGLLDLLVVSWRCMHCSTQNTIEHQYFR